jgi:uncharacterized membrane protein YkvA (DUF1232 family)
MKGRIHMDLKQRAKKLKSDIPALFLSLKDQDTPLIAKLFAGLTIAYALSPIDLIPDFIPVLGYLDDLIILPALVALTLRFIPEEVFKKNQELSINLWAEGKPKKWYYAIPMILLWIILIGIVLLILL